MPTVWLGRFGVKFFVFEEGKRELQNGKSALLGEGCKM